MMDKKWYLLGGSLIISIGLMSAYAYQSPVKEFQGISYMSADWQEDRKHTNNVLESRQGFNLRLEFMGPEQKPMKNVRVRVHDVNNKLIFERVADKSMLLMRLKPGLYQVEAEHQEQQFVTRVAVPKSRMRYVMFSWKKNSIDTNTEAQLRKVPKVNHETSEQAASDQVIPEVMRMPASTQVASVDLQKLFTPNESKRGGIYKREAKRTLAANQARPVVKILSKRTFTQ